MVDALAEAPILPKGYQEVKTSGKEIAINKSDIPWLKNETQKVSLTHVVLQDGRRFYLGSAIDHKTLVEAAENLGREGPRTQELANQTFYKQLISFVEKDYNPDVPKIQHPKTKRTIYYAKSPGGERTYFMRFDNIDGEHVIIRIAACSKNGQSKVLGVISKH